MKNGYEKRVRWITVSQQGKLERRVQQQAGQKAQQCEHQWRRWHTALRRSRGASQHAMSLHALFHSPWSSHSHSWLKIESRTFHLSSSCHTCEWLSLFDSTYSALLPSLPPVCLAFPFLPPQRRAAAVRAPTTPSTSPQVMSPTAMTSTSSRTHQSPSPSRSLSQTRMWMTWHSARCSLKRTEDKSITSYKKACQSVSCPCL